MQRKMANRHAIRASESERASIRALRNWLFRLPPTNAMDDQIVRLRIADAISDATKKASIHSRGRRMPKGSGPYRSA